MKYFEDKETSNIPKMRAIPTETYNALVAERDALKADLLKVREEASKGWYMPSKEAELERYKAKLAEAEKSMKAAAEYLNSGVVKNYLEKALARLRGDSK